MEETNNNTQEKKPKRQIIARSKRIKDEDLPKIINIRRCIACGIHRPKTLMLAVIRPPRKNGVKCMELTIQDGSLPKHGRGAYVCKSVECVLKAKKYKRFERSFTQPMAPGTYEKLEEMARYAEDLRAKIRDKYNQIGDHVDKLLTKITDERNYEEFEKLGVAKLDKYLIAQQKCQRERSKEEIRKFVEFSKKYCEILDRYDEEKRKRRELRKQQQAQKELANSNNTDSSSPDSEQITEKITE